MSLVNQMLMDLDGRHANEYCDGIQPPMQETVQVPGALLKWALLVLLFLSVLFIGFKIVHDVDDFGTAFLSAIPVMDTTKQGHSSLSESSESSSDSYLPNMSNSVRDTPETDTVLQHKVLNTPQTWENSNTRETLSDGDSDVDRLLALAQVALTRDRLTTPENDNALRYFRSVLLLDKNNSEARSGILAIAARYWEMYRLTFEQGRNQTADHYKNKVLVIANDYPFVSEVTDSFEVSSSDVTAYDASSSELAVLRDRPTSEATLAKVQSLINDGFYLDALDTINNSEEEVQQVPKILRVKAALLHQQRDFDQAAQIYRELIRLNSKEGQYWLGYASSLDAGGEVSEALNAYRRAHLYLGKNDSATNFVAQRIDALRNAVELNEGPHRASSFSGRKERIHE
ncbi:hypothetical protein NBRC116494_14360 [Aurantivibrio plasticivorans]